MNYRNFTSYLSVLILALLFLNGCDQEDEPLSLGVEIASFDQLTDQESNELFESITINAGSHLEKTKTYLVQGELSDHLISSLLEDYGPSNGRLAGCTTEKYCRGNDLWIKMSNCEKRISQQNYPSCMSSSNSVETGSSSSFIVLTGGSADGFFQEVDVNFVGGGGSGTGGDTTPSGGGTDAVVIPISNESFEEISDSFGETECASGVVNENGLCVIPCLYGEDENGCLSEAEAIYNCDCDCPLDNEGGTSDLDNMEPKWGQLANAAEIANEVSSIDNFEQLNFADQVSSLVEHFSGNRMFTRDPNGNLIDAPNSQDVNRYTYSNQVGWIDFAHVFGLYQDAMSNGTQLALIRGEFLEIFQSLRGGNYSGYSYEDLPSNVLGASMYAYYNEALSNGNISWGDALAEMMDVIGIAEPEEAPNFHYIPHILDEYYIQNTSTKGLTGEELKNLAKEAFCSKNEDVQAKIKEAHSTIGR